MKTNEELAALEINQPERYEELEHFARMALKLWVGEVIRPARTYSEASTYLIKHEFEADSSDLGHRLYVSNGALKGAIEAVHGLKPKNPNAVNWSYPIKPTCRCNKPSRMSAFALCERHSREEAIRGLRNCVAKAEEGPLFDRSFTSSTNTSEREPVRGRI